MDVVTDLPADPRATEPVRVGERALQDPALGAEPGTMPGTPSGDPRLHAEVPDRTAVHVMLVATVTRAPRPGGAEAGRAFPALRPVRDISHLMSLLHRPPHDQHAGAEAVHAAATELTVEELAELINQLQSERTAATPREQHSSPPLDTDSALPEHPSPSPGSLAPAAGTPDSKRLTAASGSGAAHFPLHRGQNLPVRALPTAAGPKTAADVRAP